LIIDSLRIHSVGAESTTQVVDEGNDVANSTADIDSASDGDTGTAHVRSDDYTSSDDDETEVAPRLGLNGDAVLNESNANAHNLPLYGSHGDTNVDVGDSVGKAMDTLPSFTTSTKFGAVGDVLLNQQLCDQIVEFIGSDANEPSPGSIMAASATVANEPSPGSIIAASATVANEPSPRSIYVVSDTEKAFQSLRNRVIKSVAGIESKFVFTHIISFGCLL